MSDHEETTSNSGYSTPVPELDDHRHQSASVQRMDRPRRGTFDSLYGAARLDPEANHSSPTHPHPSIKVRDFEDVIVDEDGGDASPLTRRTRRPTVETERSVSPPNSVKAFAEARKRERAMSFSEPRADRKNDEHELRRTTSIASRHSHRSRPYTVPDGGDTSSIETNKSAEEDVCFPVQEDHKGDHLHIDFDSLENFILSENKQHEAARRPSVRVFADLRPSSAVPALPMVTADGDFLELPSDVSCGPDEKDIHGKADETVRPATQPKDPNRYNFFSSAWESTIHAQRLGDLVLPGEDIRGLFSFPRGETDGVWWLNVSNPTEEEVRGICRAFGIHPLTIEDITTQETREKIELFPSYYFACFRSFNVMKNENGETEFEPFYIYVVVFREGTLSFSSKPNLHASRVGRRIAALKDYVALSSDWICYALIDDIVDCFAPVIQKLEHDTELIEDEVFIARTDDTHQFLRKIGNIRKNVMAVMRLLGGKADVLKGFTKRCNENYKVTPRMDIGLYLGDIQDHVVTMMTNLGHFEKMLSRSHSNYLAQLSIDGITQGTNTNRVLSKITFIASIIVPLNVITGLFGMNIMVPWQKEENLNAFGGVVGVLIAFILICLGLARKWRYI